MIRESKGIVPRNPNEVGQDHLRGLEFWVHPPIFNCRTFFDSDECLLMTNITFADEPDALRSVRSESVELLSRSTCDFAEDVPIVSWTEFLEGKG